MLTPEQIKEIELQQTEIMDRMHQQILDPVEDRKQDGLLEARDVVKEQAEKDLIEFLWQDFETMVVLLDAARRAKVLPRCSSANMEIHDIIHRLVQLTP